MCEGLSIVAGHFLSDLQEFEKQKLDEYVTYNMMNRGVQCQMGKFRNTVNRFASNLKRKDKGLVPFTYGFENDYWPEINMESDAS